MDNIYGNWEGYMEKLHEFEKSGEPETSFPLPNGKTMGEATAEEIEAFRTLWANHGGFARDEDWTGTLGGAGKPSGKQRT